MRLILLDQNFKPVAPVNTLFSLLWDRRYREPGTFEIHAGPSDFPGIREAAYVYRDDRDEFGIIYEVDIKRDKDGTRTCYAKGYFGEKLLDDRVIDRTARHAGYPEDIARKLVTDFFISPRGEGNYDGRGLAGRMELGELSGEAQSAIKWQSTGSPVGAAIYELEAAQGLTHRIKYDYERDKLVFEVWKGKNKNALLSDKYGNLTETAYHRDTTDAPNVVYVAGNGEGASRKIYLLDLREAGEGAREMYVDARDLQQHFTDADGTSYSYTDEDYEALLADRGRQKAAEHQAQERFEVSADAKANLVYRVDYDLGDVCLADIDGVQIEKQITGIREVYEPAKELVEITLGDYGPTSIQAAVTRQAQVNQETGPATANVGDLSQLTTADKTGIVPAVNELDNDIGDLSALTTTDKSSLVPAVNEINSGIGDLSALKTENKGTLVDAINEIAAGGGGGGGGAGGEDPRIGDLAKLTTAAKDLIVNAINELDKDVGDLDALDKRYIKQYSSLVDAMNYLAFSVGDLSKLNTSAKYSLVPAINELAGQIGPGGADDARPLIFAMHEIVATIETGKKISDAHAYDYTVVTKDKAGAWAAVKLKEIQAVFTLSGQPSISADRIMRSDPAMDTYSPNPGMAHGTVMLSVKATGKIRIPTKEFGGTWSDYEDGGDYDMRIHIPCQLIPVWRGYTDASTGDYSIGVVAYLPYAAGGVQEYEQHNGTYYPRWGRVNSVSGDIYLTTTDADGKTITEGREVWGLEEYLLSMIDAREDNPVGKSLVIGFERIKDAEYPSPEWEVKAFGCVSVFGTSGEVRAPVWYTQ